MINSLYRILFFIVEAQYANPWLLFHTALPRFFSYDRLASQRCPVDKSSLYEAKKKGVNIHFSDARLFSE